MRPPPPTRPKAVHTTLTERTGDCGAEVAKMLTGQHLGRFRTFEPWLAGDRQMAGDVAKPRYPNAIGLFEVSLS